VNPGNPDWSSTCFDHSIVAKWQVILTDLKHKDKELVNKRWEEYRRLPDKKREEYQKKMNWPLEITREQFDEISKDEDYSPEQAAIEYMRFNRDMFHGAISVIAKEKGIEGEFFYGLLEQGYNPHEVQTKGFKLFGFGSERVVIPKRAGQLKEFSPSEYDSFVKKTGEEYVKRFESLAKKKLSDLWDGDREDRIAETIEARIKELAESPEIAEGGIEKLYQKVKDRIVAEYLEKQAKKKSERTSVDEAKIDKEFGDARKIAGAEKKERVTKSLTEIISDTTADTHGNRTGELESLTGDFEEDVGALSSYFNSLGVAGMTPGKLKRIIKSSESKNIYKKSFGKKYGLFDWFFYLLEDKPWNVK
jgi:hypothetical protein